jgi:hypothetical protein
MAMELIHCYCREYSAENRTLKRRCIVPEKVLPDEEDFQEFKERMIINECFRMISKPEFASSFQRLGLSNPRKRLGREVGFTFSASGLTVVVWTTFLDAEKCAREEDAGWVLIAEGDKVKYFSHPLMRTSGFFDRLLMHARIAKQRVLNRPLCPACHAFMEIARGKGLKSRYWICRNKSHTLWLPWDIGICANFVKFLEAERKARRRYRNKLKKAGKPTGQALLNRRPWTTAKPQNRI